MCELKVILNGKNIFYECISAKIIDGKVRWRLCAGGKWNWWTDTDKKDEVLRRIHDYIADSILLGEHIEESLKEDNG